MSIGEKLQIRLEKVTAERDALAATVNHMKALADEAYGSYASCHDDECAAALTKMVGVDPATSLARLKAEWQAEVLEDMAQEFRRRMDSPRLLCLIDATHLEKEANRLRGEPKQ